eukprot:1055946-Prorocentrum_minimum.AAC.4
MRVSAGTRRPGRTSCRCPCLGFGGGIDPLLVPKRTGGLRGVYPLTGHGSWGRGLNLRWVWRTLGR